MNTISNNGPLSDVLNNPLTQIASYVAAPFTAGLSVAGLEAARVASGNKDFSLQDAALSLLPAGVSYLNTSGLLSGMTTQFPTSDGVINNFASGGLDAATNTSPWVDAARGGVQGALNVKDWSPNTVGGSRPTMVENLFSDYLPKGSLGGSENPETDKEKNEQIVRDGPAPGQTYDEWLWDVWHTANVDAETGGGGGGGGSTSNATSAPTGGSTGSIDNAPATVDDGNTASTSGNPIGGETLPTEPGAPTGGAVGGGDLDGTPPSGQDGPQEGNPWDVYFEVIDGVRYHVVKNNDTGEIRRNPVDMTEVVPWDESIKDATQQAPNAVPWLYKDTVTGEIKFDPVVFENANFPEGWNNEQPGTEFPTEGTIPTTGTVTTGTANTNGTNGTTNNTGQTDGTSNSNGDDATQGEGDESTQSEEEASWLDILGHLGHIFGDPNWGGWGTDGNEGGGLDGDIPGDGGNGDNDTGDGGPDDGGLDPGPGGDGDDPDGETQDGEGPDGAGPDGEGPDGEGPDGEGPDGEGPDGEGPDIELPGGGGGLAASGLFTGKVSDLFDYTKLTPSQLAKLVPLIDYVAKLKQDAKRA
jgi:hypothetical protein